MQFRYRYDTETGLYYLQSRYYNPEWGRFINSDALGGSVGELLSHNIFAYCSNNSINMKDDQGFMASEAQDGGGGAYNQNVGNQPVGGSISSSGNFLQRLSQTYNYGLSRLKYGIQGPAKADFYVAPSGVTFKGAEWSFYKNVGNFKNMTKKQIVETLPSGWQVKGRAIYDKVNMYKGRIDPPDNITNYNHIHLYDYFNKNNNKLNILLDEKYNRVPYNSQDGHIKILP